MQYNLLKKKEKLESETSQIPCNKLVIYKSVIQLYHMQLLKRIRYLKGKEVQDMFLTEKKKTVMIFKSCQKIDGVNDDDEMRYLLYI